MPVQSDKKFHKEKNIYMWGADDPAHAGRWGLEEGGEAGDAGGEVGRDGLSGEVRVAVVFNHVFLVAGGAWDSLPSVVVGYGCRADLSDVAVNVGVESGVVVGNKPFESPGNVAAERLVLTH